MAGAKPSGNEPVPGYRCVKFLGRGGFGEVWKATAPGGTEVAIKLINLAGNQGLKEFRAIQRVRRIRHPHLVPILAFWLKDEAGNILDDTFATTSDIALADPNHAIPSQLIIAMGLGDKNLLDRLKECQKQGLTGIPERELINYMEEAGKALDFLNSPSHDLGNGLVAIQHCDIKPQNVMIVGGSAQICDFGLARMLGGEMRNTDPAVSVAYGAPELLNDNKPSSSTDQYSLAISYVELRTGQLPFLATSWQAMFVARMQGLDLTKLAPPEQAVIRRATSFKPEDRYPTTQDMVRELRRAVEGGSRPSLPEMRLPLAGPLEAGCEVVPGYRLVRKLGEGTFGEAWEATGPGGVPAALKIVQKLDRMEGKQDFKALELLKRVSHNHLMELRGYWLIDGNGQIIPDEFHSRPDAPPVSTLVMATKLVDKNLQQRLQECLRKAGAPIAVHELLGYMRQAAQAIDHLNAPKHKMGGRLVSIQHRDIKPQNILLADEVVKVSDFALAKVVEDTSEPIPGGSVGCTPAYAAPETLNGEVTPWTDQFSLAVTYFELRTGQNLDGPLERLLDSLPEPERNVISRATSYKAEERFLHCREMVRALEQACGLATGTVIGGVPAARPSTSHQAMPSNAPTLVSPPRSYQANPVPPPYAPPPVPSKTGYSDPSRPAPVKTKTPAAVAGEDPFQTIRGQKNQPLVETLPPSARETDKHPTPDLEQVLSQRAAPAWQREAPQPAEELRPWKDESKKGGMGKIIAYVVVASLLGLGGAALVIVVMDRPGKDKGTQVASGTDVSKSDTGTGAGPTTKGAEPPKTTRKIEEKPTDPRAGLVRDIEGAERQLADNFKGDKAEALRAAEAFNKLLDPVGKDAELRPRVLLGVGRAGAQAGNSSDVESALTQLQSEKLRPEDEIYRSALQLWLPARQHKAGGNTLQVLDQFIKLDAQAKDAPGSWETSWENAQLGRGGPMRRQIVEATLNHAKALPPSDPGKPLALLEKAKLVPTDIKTASAVNKEVKDLQDLQTIKDPNRSVADRLQAAERLVVMDAHPGKAEESAKELVALAKAKPEARKRALEYLNDGGPQFLSALKDLLGKIIEEKVTSSRAFKDDSERKRFFKDLEKECVAADSDKASAWVKLGLAEALIAATDAPTSEEVKKAAKTAAEAPKDLTAESYENYVSALVIVAGQDTKTYPAAAERILRAYKTTPPPLLQGYRQQRAVALLDRAADALVGRGSDRLFFKYSSNEDADDAFRWLDKASQLFLPGDDPGLQLRINVYLLLAAAETKDPAGAPRYQALLKGILNTASRRQLEELSRPRGVVCAVLKAKAEFLSKQDTPQALNAALDAYVEILNVLAAVEPNAELHKEVLLPAYDAADRLGKLPGGIKAGAPDSRVSLINFWSGRYLNKNNNRDEAISAFARALASTDQPETMLPRILFQELKRDPKDCLEVLNQTLPKDRSKFQPRHTLACIYRMELVLNTKTLLDEDLKNPEPSGILDKETLRRLDQDPSYQAKLHAGAYVAIGKLPANRGKDFEAAKAYHYEELGKLLLNKATYAKWEQAPGWAKFFAEQYRATNEAKAKEYDEMIKAAKPNSSNNGFKPPTGGEPRRFALQLLERMAHAF